MPPRNDVEFLIHATTPPVARNDDSGSHATTLAMTALLHGS
ncbi:MULTISPECIES: hypothetical protein [unclassified Rickettsia]